MSAVKKQHVDGDLPPVLADIKELVGWEFTLKLVQTYGGVYIDVPLVNSDGNYLNRVLSYSAAAKLIQRYGGTRVYISKLHGALSAARDREIRHKYFGQDVPARQLALEYGLSIRRIHDILARPGDDKPDNQMSMDV